MKYNIIISSWRDGLQKVALDKLLATKGGLGLATAKKLVDRMLDDEAVFVGPLSLDEAKSLADEIESLGAHCTIEPEDATN